MLTDQHHFRSLKWWWLPANLQMMTLEAGFFVHLLISFSQILFLHLDLTKCDKSTIYCNVYEVYTIDFYRKNQENTSILCTFLAFFSYSFHVLSVTVFGSSSRNRRATRPLRVCCATTPTVAPVASTGTRKSWGWWLLRLSDDEICNFLF